MILETLGARRIAVPECAVSRCGRRKKRTLAVWDAVTQPLSVAARSGGWKLPLKSCFGKVAPCAPQKWDECIDLQLGLGLVSFDTAWSMLLKMGLAMVRPGRERLSGNVEVDETYSGAPSKR